MGGSLSVIRLGNIQEVLTKARLIHYHRDTTTKGNAMAKVWVAYRQTIHYLVDTYEREIEQVEIPGWLNTFDYPEAVWLEDGTVLTSAPDEVVEILENESMPEPYWS